MDIKIGSDKIGTFYFKPDLSWSIAPTETEIGSFPYYGNYFYANRLNLNLPPAIKNYLADLSKTINVEFTVIYPAVTTKDCVAASTINIKISGSGISLVNESSKIFDNYYLKTAAIEGNIVGTIGIELLSYSPSKPVGKALVFTSRYKAILNSAEETLVYPLDWSYPYKDFKFEYSEGVHYFICQTFNPFFTFTVTGPFYITGVNGGRHYSEVSFYYKGFSDPPIIIWLDEINRIQNNIPYGAHPITFKDNPIFRF